MTERISIRLYNPQRAHADMAEAWKWVKAMLIAGHRLVLEVRRETRTTAQNRMLFSILTDLSNQCEWVIDGKLSKAEPEEVKDILTAGLKKHQRMAQGLDGGVVFLGMRTSRMTVGEVSDLITLGHSVGDQRGVVWSRTSLGRDWPEEVEA